MRLKPEEVSAIKEAILRFDPDAKIFLFGSRAQDSKRGGDIDLLIFSHLIKNSDKGKIRLRIEDRIGAQKIDIVIAEDETDSFIRLAKEEGVPL